MSESMNPAVPMGKRRLLSIVIPPRHPTDSLLEITDCVQQLFLSDFASQVGEEARSHLRNVRKLPEWLIEEEGFGYLRGGEKPVITHLLNHGYSLEAAAEAGVISRSAWATQRAFESAHGKPAQSDVELTEFFLTSCASKPEFYHDYPSCLLANGRRQFGRWLTIPIRLRTSSGKLGIAGFQYRSMRSENEISPRQGRYMSPRNSPLLQWTQTLFGLAEEMPVLERSRHVIICEGKFDQVAVRAAVRELPEDKRPAVVALGGVQARGWMHSDDPRERAGVLAQIATNHATFLLDWDHAGIDAVLRLGPLLSQLGTHVSVASIVDAGSIVRDGEDWDPSKLYAAGGAEAVLRVLEAARSRGLATFAIECLERTRLEVPYSGQTWYRLRHLDRFFPILQALPISVRDRAIRHVADSLDLPASAVETGLAHYVGATTPSISRMRR